MEEDCLPVKNGWYHMYYDTYKLNSTHKQYLNGLRHGMYIKRVGGVVVQITFYCMGKLQGSHRCWDTRGRPTLYANYRKDKLHGDYKEWDVDGYLRNHFQFKHGQLHGVYKCYQFRSTSLLEWSMYQHGRRDGIRKFWNYTLLPNGGYLVYASSRYTREYYINGRLVVKNFAVRKIVSILHLKNKLRQRAKHRIRKTYLDQAIIPDLGNIVMIYYLYGE